MKLARSVMVAGVLSAGLGIVSTASALEPLWAPAAGQVVIGTSGLSVVHSALGDLFHCEKDVFIGTITSSLLIGKASVHFLECVSMESPTSATCTVKSVGAPSEGLILWNEVHGILGLILPSGETGILWLPVKSSIFTELEGNACTPATKVTGTVASTVEPVGKKQTTGKFVFPAASIKHIDLTHGLGLRRPELIAFTGTATLQGTEEVTFGEATEVT